MLNGYVNYTAPHTEETKGKQREGWGVRREWRRDRGRGRWGGRRENILLTYYSCYSNIEIQGPRGYQEPLWGLNKYHRHKEDTDSLFSISTSGTGCTAWGPFLALPYKGSPIISARDIVSVGNAGVWVPLAIVTDIYVLWIKSDLFRVSNTDSRKISIRNWNLNKAGGSYGGISIEIKQVHCESWSTAIDLSAAKYGPILYELYFSELRRGEQRVKCWPALRTKASNNGLLYDKR